MTWALGASWCVAIAGIGIGLATLAVFRTPLLALRVCLELLTAAGLLRLSVDAAWTAIAGVAILIAVRRVVTRALTADLTVPPTPARS